MVVQEQRHASFALTAEGTTYLDSGSPEAQVFSAIPAEGIPQSQLIVRHCSCSLSSTEVAVAVKLPLHKLTPSLCCSKSLAMLAAWAWARP